MTNAEIIGYKAPFNTFHIEGETIVKKGDIYVKDYISRDRNGYLLRKDFFTGRTGKWNENITFLPSEIVETWEPVYADPHPTREEITAKWVKDNEVKVGDTVIIIADKPFMAKGTRYKVKEINSYCITCEGYAEECDFNVEDIRKATRKVVKFTFEDREMFRDKWVREKGSSQEFKLSVINIFGVQSEFGEQSRAFSYEDSLEEIEFIDGTPFGKEIWE